MSYFGNINVITNNGTGDAFGRLRVSSPETIFDSKQTVDSQPLLWDDQQTSGAGTTSTYSKARASTTMSVSANTAGTRIRQTFRRFNYQPGKSQLIFLTGVLGLSSGAGIVRSAGYFDDNNGIFARDSEGTLQVVRRSYVTGSPQDEVVDQINWNMDKLNGSGPSGLTIDPTKAQILVIDLEWLGVGRARIGFNIDGVTHYVHEFKHANRIASVYMSTPNLPIRFSISNDGTGPAATLEHICCSVISEGGSEDTGRVIWDSTSGTHVTCTTENVIYAIMGIRLKSTSLDATVKLLRAEIAIQTVSELIEWMIIFNPTVAGTFTYGDLDATSSVQVAKGATANTVTNGTRIAGGFLASAAAQGGGTGVGGESLSNAILLGSSISGTPDTIVLCARPIGGASNVEVEGGLSWREIQ